MAIANTKRLKNSGKRYACYFSSEVCGSRCTKQSIIVQSNDIRMGTLDGPNNDNLLKVMLLETTSTASIAMKHKENVCRIL